MKRFYKFLLPLVAIVTMALPWNVQAQELGDYIFSTDTSSEMWVDMSSATQILTPSGNDGLASSLQNIGFTFPFGDASYTQYSVNTDGNLRLGSTVTGTGSYSTPFSSSNANTNSPKINAFGCDGYGVSSIHYVKALSTTDDNSLDMLVVEFCMGTYTSSTRNELYKWQIHMHANGDIDIVFPGSDDLPATAPAVSHQCGLCVNSSDGWVISLTTNTATHFTAGSSSTNSSGTWFDANRYYTFTRPVLTCPKPAVLNGIPGTTWLNLNWPYGGTETEWEILCDSVSYYPTDTFFTVTGLTPNTVYEVMVRAICGVDDTSGWRSATFRTDCVPIDTLPYVQNFNSCPTGSANLFDPCWNIYCTYSPTSHYPYVSSGYLYMYMYHSSNVSTMYGYAMLPPLVDDISDDDLELTFTIWKSSSTGYNNGVIVALFDSTSTPANPVFDTLAIIIPTATSQAAAETQYVLVPVEGLNGKRIGFFYQNQDPGATSVYYYYTYIDDVDLHVAPTCSHVVNLEVEAVTTGSAYVTWTPGPAGVYDGAVVEYRDTTSSTWTTLNTNRKLCSSTTPKRLKNRFTCWRL